MSIKTNANRRSGGLRSVGQVFLVTAACAAIGAGAAYAKGGTAKPPPPGQAATPLVVVLPPAGPTLQFLAPGSNGFSITGFVQSATATCGTPTAGGTVTINGVVITIPTNTIVQFPAFTATWTDTEIGRASCRERV